MANKAISELPQALNVNNQDLFVLEQSGIAKKLPAETFITEQGIINALAEALDGHGGIQSVTLSSVSGRIRTYRITFTDQSATTFQVYDGTSIDRISRTSSSGLDDVYTIFLSDGTTTFFTVHNGADGTVSEAMLNDALKDKAPAITETTESSAIANFTDGADDMVMHNVVAEINPVQDLSNGDPSPSNICPITGWTGCNVTRTGKNLLEVTAESVTTKGVTFTVNSDGSVLVDGTATETISFYLNSAVQLPNGSFILSGCPSGGSSGNGYSLQGSGGPPYDAGAGSSSFSEINGGGIRIRIAAGVSCNNLLFKPMIRLASDTDSAYEPYQGTTLSVDWTSEAGTVYGGTIDVATGLLTVDRVMKTVTASETGWLFATGASANRVAVTAPNSKLSPAGARTSTISNIAVADANIPLSTSRYEVGYFCMYSGGSDTESRAIFCVPSDCTTAASAVQWLADNGCVFVYYLATPQTYQLTPQQLLTLLGTNNVWSDIGNVSVTYPADTKMFIEKLTMPTEDDLVANQAITSGKYFMVGNSLYLALANIASGAQITIGTNAQRVSLADALNTINT